jgi:ketosteroid isomerase-like protein
VSQTDDSFEAFLAERPAVGQAHVSGDSEPLTAISTARDPATFFSPTGGYVSGAAAVLATNQAGATDFRPGSHSEFEIFHAGSSGELGYLVGIQHADVLIADQPDPVSMHLRITELYRREDGAWKLIHRHADPHAKREPPAR